MITYGAFNVSAENEVSSYNDLALRPPEADAIPVEARTANKGHTVHEGVKWSFLSAESVFIGIIQWSKEYRESKKSE